MALSENQPLSHLTLNVLSTRTLRNNAVRNFNTKKTDETCNLNWRKIWRNLERKIKPKEILFILYAFCENKWFKLICMYPRYCVVYAMNCVVSCDRITIEKQIKWTWFQKDRMKIWTLCFLYLRILLRNQWCLVRLYIIW